MRRSLFLVAFLAFLAACATAQPIADAPHNETAPFAAATGCAVYSACDTCTKNNECVWCGSNDAGAGTCISGSFFGPKTGDFNGGCHHWNFGQCVLTGLVMFIMIGSGAGLIILIVLICLCRCMCCSGRRRAARNADLYVPLAEDGRGADMESLHPKTDAKRREMEEKYGRSFGADRSAALDSRSAAYN